MGCLVLSIARRASGAMFASLKILREMFVMRTLCDRFCNVPCLIRLRGGGQICMVNGR